MAIDERLEAAAAGAPPEAKAAAEALGIFERGRMQVSMIDLENFAPEVVAPPDEEFSELYAAVAAEGATIAAQSKIVFVGQARQIESILPLSIRRIENMGAPFKEWGACIIENDSTDDTKKILEKWQADRPGRVQVSCRDYGREHLRGWESERVRRYAQYRNEGKALAKACHPDADFVCVVDLDPWGGWSLLGLLNGIGWLARLPRAGGMASTSLFQAEDVSGERLWAHYDAWAFRWPGWSHKMQRWFTVWIPPVGSPPIQVRSAFGAMTTYRAEPFFKSDYEGGPDIEHVGLHKNMARLGYDMYLNPSQRVVMNWLPPKQNDESCHRDHPPQ